MVNLPTIANALRRWQKYYKNQVSLIAIGVGQYAALDTLRQLTDQVLHQTHKPKMIFASLLIGSASRLLPKAVAFLSVAMKV